MVFHNQMEILQRKDIFAVIFSLNVISNISQLTIKSCIQLSE